MLPLQDTRYTSNHHIQVHKGTLNLPFLTADISLLIICILWLFSFGQGRLECTGRYISTLVEESILQVHICGPKRQYCHLSVPSS